MSFSRILFRRMADHCKDRFRKDFLDKRRIGLAYFMKCVNPRKSQLVLILSLSCVLLNPEFSGSPVLKEFIFS